MKLTTLKFIAITAGLLFSCSSLVFAQNTATEVPMPNSIVKIQPFQFIDNTFYLGYEGFNPESTRSFNLGLGFKTSNSGTAQEETGIKSEIQYRFYVDGFKNYVNRRNGSSYRRGIYASIYLSNLYQQSKGEVSAYDPNTQIVTFRSNVRTIVAFNPGVTLGIQRSFWDILYLDAWVGGGVRFSSYKDSNRDVQVNPFEYFDIFQPEYQGVFPKIGLSIGVGF